MQKSKTKLSKPFYSLHFLISLGLVTALCVIPNSSFGAQKKLKAKPVMTQERKASPEATSPRSPSSTSAMNDIATSLEAGFPIFGSAFGFGALFTAYLEIPKVQGLDVTGTLGLWYHSSSSSFAGYGGSSTVLTFPILVGANYTFQNQTWDDLSFFVGASMGVSIVSVSYIKQQIQVL